MLPQLSLPVSAFKRVVRRLLQALCVLAVVVSLTACNGSQPPRALLNEALALRIGAVGLASALLGVIAGLICTDMKRLLAWSTLSQMGLLVLMPASAGLFGLAHGLAKAALFLSCRQLPTRALAHWNLGHCRPDQRLAFWLAPLSLAGLPPLIGSLAKIGTPSLAGPWLAPLLSLIAILAIAVYARLWSRGETTHAPGDLTQATAAGARGWSAGVVLLLALLWLPLLRPASLVTFGCKEAAQRSGRDACG